VRAPVPSARTTSLDHTREDVAARVRELTGRKGVEVVVEHVGGPVFEAAVRSLARDGRLVTCGATIGAEVTLDLNLLFGRHLSLLGSWMGRRDDLLAALEHVASGAIAPVVDEVMPLAEARRAHARIEAREHFGKVVLVP
jgi:NADPH:quinone reductase-like Zn-dependent oxidoreductase